jgi:hypothetical protein
MTELWQKIKTWTEEKLRRLRAWLGYDAVTSVC